MVHTADSGTRAIISLLFIYPITIKNIEWLRHIAADKLLLVEFLTNGEVRERDARPEFFC